MVWGRGWQNQQIMKKKDPECSSISGRSCFDSVRYVAGAPCTSERVSRTPWRTELFSSDAHFRRMYILVAQSRCDITGPRVNSAFTQGVRPDPSRLQGLQDHTRRFPAQPGYSQWLTLSIASQGFEMGLILAPISISTQPFSTFPILPNPSIIYF